VDIDMKALRGLVQERQISFDLLVEAIESALLIAYHREPGSNRLALAA
jgi:N utilization substance protein A